VVNDPGVAAEAQAQPPRRAEEVVEGTPEAWRPAAPDFDFVCLIGACSCLA